MDTNDPNVNLGFLIAEIARLMRARFNVTAQKFGLTLAQGRVLAHLGRNEGISQVALSAILDVQPITLLRQIDRLEKAGLLERRVHPTDRRVQQLFLTPLSQPLLDKMYDVHNAVHGQVMAGLDAAQRDQLITALAKIRANLAQPSAHADVAVTDPMLRVES